MTSASTHARLGRLALIAAAVVSAAVLLAATPPTPIEPPPTGQIRVAPIAAQSDDPLEVLVPGDMSRVLSPFMALLEGDGPDDGRPSVWNASATGLGYSATP